MTEEKKWYVVHTYSGYSEVPEVLEVPEVPEVPVVAEVGEDKETGSRLEPLDETDFELLLSTIDLSSLEQWDRGPAGAEEADATRSEANGKQAAVVDSPDPDEIMEEDVPLSLADDDEDDVDIEILDLLPTADEELAPANETALDNREETDDGKASDIGVYLGPCIRYHPFVAFERRPVFEELPVVGDGEPWSEVEFLEDDVDEEFVTEGGIIEYRDGIFRLNADLAKIGDPKTTVVPEDPGMRALVDSVLGSNGESQR